MGRRKLYKTSLLIRFLTFIVFTVFVLRFKIKKKIPHEVKKLKSPYLLLSNHVGYWDPFLVGHLLPRFTHFVSSDAAFKAKIPGFFLTRLGTIPKKKNIRDTKVVRDIATVMAQGENVGLFPEAVRNWAGSTLAIDPSIGKLIKLLNVPVIVAVMKGMNLFNPRWAKGVRKTRVEVFYQLLFTPKSISSLTPDEIHAKLVTALQHDEIAYQRKHMHKIKSDKRAEHISHSLYICPDCNAIDSFRAKGNNFICTHCSYDIYINTYGFFERLSPGNLYFDNIRDWYYWEEKWFVNYISEKFESNFKEMLFVDENSLIYYSKPDEKLEFIGRADLKLFIDRIEIIFKDTVKTIVLNLNDLQTINPQVHEKLEIFFNHHIYRCIGGRPGVSGLKWEVAINALWKKMGQNQKLSPYINM